MPKCVEDTVCAVQRREEEKLAGHCHKIHPEAEGNNQFINKIALKV